MNLRTGTVLRNVVISIIGAGVLGALFLWVQKSAGPELVAKTSAALRQQGFKPDLSQFNFSTSPEMREREAALTAWISNRAATLPQEWPRVTDTIGDDARVVIWSQDMVKWPHPLPQGAGDQITWNEFREIFDENQGMLDAACQAALSDPIRFNLDAGRGHYMLLPHLAPLKRLAEALASRAMLALHDHNQDAAWTNLMAATRLVTAWEIEPAEVSHMVRFSMMSLLFDATWQALQASDWPETRLAQLQTEWERMDFLGNLAETGEFKLASDAGEYEIERRQPSSRMRPALPGLSSSTFRSPLSALSQWRERWNASRYWDSGQYEEERDVLLFDRDRVIELRNAVKAPTWAQMSRLPGVTNSIPFHAKYRYGRQSRRSMREITMGFQRGSMGFLGRAAQAEAQRRILITALALERYRSKHAAYPQTAAALAPEFLKTEPIDFIDGQRLRFQLNDEGHYRLYSVGLDCVDHGGRIAKAAVPYPLAGATQQGDVVWPFPASATTVATVRRQQSAMLQDKADEISLRRAQTEWGHAARHQADAEKLLAAPNSQLSEVNFHGQPLSKFLRNTDTVGSNQLTLSDMLTLKQIVTGDEPEQVTFELPISYDALKRAGEIYLLVDTNNDDSDEGCVAQQMTCSRADNGNCRVVWSTLFESHGKHALRAALDIHGRTSEKDSIVGPPLPFIVSNLCQFSLSSAHYDPRQGAAFLLKLPETSGQFVLKCQTNSSAALRTITGAASNGIVSVHWDLLDDHGRRFDGQSFDTIWTITLPASGRSQTLKGP